MLEELEKLGYIFVKDADPSYLRTLVHLGSKPLFMSNMYLIPLICVGRPYGSNVSSVCKLYDFKLNANVTFTPCSEKDKLNIVKEFERNGKEWMHSMLLYLLPTIYFK